MTISRNNPYYVDVTHFMRDPHYITFPIYNVPPLLYTCNLAGCVGIGFVYSENNTVVKLGLYHSFGEHGNAEYGPFQMMVNDFMRDVKNIRNLRVIISFSQGIRNDELVTLKMKIDKAGQAFNLPPISLKNLVAVDGGPTFCLLANGSYSSDRASVKDNDKIAQYIAGTILSRVFAKISSDHSLSEFYKPVIENIFDAANEKTTWQQACQVIYTWMEQKLKLQEVVMQTLVRGARNNPKLFQSYNTELPYKLSEMDFCKDCKFLFSYFIDANIFEIKKTPNIV
ncbi:hypothetical protein AQUSIP_06480 [Aquicella siphonis]|uniref:Uncharacterized protein n=1 Tax=Aquicella siphonis TaxID=254247 RepID=A0A5E4PFS6_9COXI|nr:hypothetical protein [Aquicella siphonis]VVC75358.1 hypothetical protein AQUSIP_06480 [Aquicella siphonis]